MKKIIIPSGQAGKRVDRFLSKEVFCNGEVSRADIIRKIKAGKILINGGTVKPSYVLKEGDEITVSSLLRQLADSPEGREGSVLPNARIKIKIIEDNKNFLVIDKPAGIQVHPDAHEKKNTVANWLVAKYPEIKNVHDKSREAKLRPGIVHRLDKDTSGVMVLAKNQKTFEALKNLFQMRKVKKAYLAIVHGTLKEETGVIETALAKAANYKRQTIATSRTKTKVRPAMTEYKVKKEMTGYSLIEAFPKTGRTHQIRVHLWSIGHPMVGDALYKLKSQGVKLKAEGNPIRRQLLHAEKLSFKLGNKAYSFEAKMPKDMRDFLKGLK